jgi:ubiquinone/menaquinone biosynthesis C-methylase UbiE
MWIAFLAANRIALPANIRGSPAGENMIPKPPLIKAFSRIAPRYEQVVDGELQRFWGWGYHGFIDTLLDHTPLTPGDVILDVATGTAVIPAKLASRFPNQLTLHGLDITLAMLHQAQKHLAALPSPPAVKLVCASAMAMPYFPQVFDLALCALATHHMDIHQLLAEIHRTLKPEGCLVIGDVGGSPFWRLPLVQPLLRLLGFFYFLIVEDKDRAFAESDAVPNVHSPEEWLLLLENAGFHPIQLTRLPSKHRWIPQPVILIARKQL